MLTWPDGLMYQMFRSQFLAFSIFQSCVQFLQYYYQRGCLYRLRALGERNHLDLTVEGFQSWMWRGLTFLLPFLFCGHFWQLYNAITLFGLSRHKECKEWQVCVLAFTFLLLFLGNFLTTLKVVHTKLQKNKDKMKKLWTLQGVLGANSGARCPCAHSRRLVLDGASWTAAALWTDFEELICAVFGEGCGLFQHRLSILCKHGSPVCSPIYVYLIPNVFALGFSVYIAACTCSARSQHWENVGSTVIPVLEWYLTLSSFII